MAGSVNSLSTVKVIVLGNGSAGKSSICNRLKADGFLPVYKQTVGIDWHEKRMVVRGKELILQLHDIGGQSLSSQMIGSYVAGAHVVFLLYDVTDMQSFRDLDDWLAVTRKHNLTTASTVANEPTTAAPSSLKEDGVATSAKGTSAGSGLKATDAASPQLVFVLANKVDLPHMRKVTAEMHDDFIRSNHLQGGFQVSAKTGENVLKAFYAASGLAIGIELTEEELAFTDKVLAATISKQADETVRPGAEDIEREDMEAEAKKKGGCCIVQ